MKNLHGSKAILVAFIRRYHLVLFTVITVLLLSTGILLLSGIVGKASGADTPPQNSTSSSFDQETIDRIKNLKTSDQPSEPLDLSGRRINPFSE